MNQFHFTIGPVQGFVAQARRTRDFWAGSFLLSWLAGIAMKAVEKHGGTVLFPRVHGSFLRYLEGRQEGEAPRQGSVPNRFRAEVPTDFPTAAVEASVRRAWAALGDLVWRRDGLAGVATTSTRGIWDRQVRGFWQIAWTLADDPADSAILDRRKNWRSDFPEPEDGVKCTMMEGWQELSGAERPNSRTLSDFWNRLRERTGFDLAPAEHLCAVAYIKRRFVRSFAELGVEMPGGWTLRGWPLEPGVPSVTYVAVAHWLETLLLAKEEAANRREIHAAAIALAEGNPEINRSERGTRIRCVRDAARTAGDNGSEMAILDGRVYFPDSLVAEPDVFPPDKVARLASAVKNVGLEARPSPFYAVLMMDGDSLGRLMGEVRNQTRISDALAEFTAAVPDIIEEENGFLIYAGGDDVLALLPLEDALPCAARVREAYLAACARQEVPSTISAAVEFAHMKTPLTKILHDAHSLLDEVAKDRCNRDGLAVRIWKPGGLPVEWALPWEAAAPDGELLLDRVAASFKAREGGGEAAFTSKLFYKLRDRFELLNPAADAEEEAPGLPEEVAERLLAAELLASGINRELPKKDRLSFDQARDTVRPLLELCRPQSRQLDDDGRATGLDRSSRIEADGALLVRFLVNKGIER